MVLINFSAIVLSKDINILAITEDFASIAQSIGGTRVSVSSLLSGSKDLHAIHPKPSMVLKVKNADLLIRIGMEQDSWVDSLIGVAKNRHVFPGADGYLDASQGVVKLEVPKGKIDGRLGDVHKEGNPHYWLDPYNGKKIAMQILERLIKLDPENHQLYLKNYQVFVQKIDDKMVEWQERLVPYKSFSFITYHKTWPYFFNAFSLMHIGELEPLPGVPPSAKHLNQLRKNISKNGHEVIVLVANIHSRKVAKSFASSINARCLIVSPHVGSQGVKDYIALLEALVSKISQT